MTISPEGGGHSEFSLLQLLFLYLLEALDSLFFYT